MAPSSHFGRCPDLSVSRCEKRETGCPIEMNISLASTEDWSKVATRGKNFPALRLGLAQGVQCVAQGALENSWPCSTDPSVNLLQSANEVGNLSPSVRPASGGAKMSPATERPRFVDEAVARNRFQEGTGAKAILRQPRPPGSAQTQDGFQCLATGQKRSATGQFEMTTFRPSQAIPLDGAP